MNKVTKTILIGCQLFFYSHLSQSLTSDTLLANVHLFIDCSTQHPKPETGDSSNAQIPLDRMDTSKPDLIASSDIFYAQIEQNVSGNDDLYANVTSENNNEDSGGVVYSELQRKNSVADALEPAGDLYANYPHVQKL